ncbi:hypothetical protein F5X98DRAFT_385553 [Xylaria grammica]|nr:hypothetical protein F5X98DRAFT_385553 [Xylaria grammica]
MSQDLWVERDIIAEARGRLFGYFARDAERRFAMENAIGGGVAGLTWKIQYMPTPGQARYIVLKTDRVYSRVAADVDFEYQSSLLLERQNLEILRWAKHTVKEVKVDRDPLAETLEGLQSHYMQMGHWLYLEWLENGTVKSMVEKARFNRIRLPNRFLWRAFLCLIRMCIAMGWPPAQPPGPDPQPVSERARGGATAGYQHRDMHSANLMFGGLQPNDPDREHLTVPILKLIDLGTMLDHSVNDRRLADTSVAENLFDIGRELAAGIYPSVGEAQPFRVAANGPLAVTNGVQLLPGDDGVEPFPELDADLRGLVCACLAPEPAARPRAGALANAVLTAVNGRDAAFYAGYGVRGESDEDLRALVGRLFFDAM